MREASQDLLNQAFRLECQIRALSTGATIHTINNLIQRLRTTNEERLLRAIKDCIEFISKINYREVY